MSSSGIIYAVIVGAWAVYLVPMWLRREDELNHARQTQRYAAAIKVLANKEAFERRWAQPGEAEEALPLAVGQSSVSAYAATATKRVTATGKGSNASQETRAASPSATKPKPKAKPANRPVVAATTAPATSRTAVTAKLPASDTRSTNATRSRATSPTSASTPAVAATPATTPRRPMTVTGPKAPVTRTRTGLMARRRRVVALLFAVSTLGAVVSADLGAQYLWVMAIPAVLLSAYIARLRSEERVRAAAHAAKYAAAQQAREAREAELARAEAANTEAARAEAAQVEAAETEAARGQSRAEAEQRRRAEAARRRSSAAARARAQAYTHEAPDFRQASNG